MSIFDFFSIHRLFYPAVLMSRLYRKGHNLKDNGVGQSNKTLQNNAVPPRRALLGRTQLGQESACGSRHAAHFYPQEKNNHKRLRTCEREVQVRLRA